jgi:hypothetical protein
LFVKGEELIIKFAEAQVEASLSHADELNGVSVHQGHLNDFKGTRLQINHSVELVIVKLVNDFIA